MRRISSKVQDGEVAVTEQIAIIGMGCRFPGAPDLQTFWKMMCNGVDAITEVPADRFDITTVYDPHPGIPGKIMSRWGGFLEQVDRFDAAFFGISPREAERMDPQQRLLLEVAWEAMEDAGQLPEELSKEIGGVFIGLITSDYWDRQFRNPVDLDVYSTTGSARSGAAGRISYALGLRGISVAVDAACSSSLVAVHLACQSLRAGSCTLAIAGGVNMILNPDHTIGYSQGKKMMASDGHCKAFDARADGYVRSEGAGIVVLKPLPLALADNDPIYAVIQGSAVNNDGNTDLFMTPSIQGQQDVLRQAYRDAGISPGRVHYVETHGTGTGVGDPVELKALGSVLAEDRSGDSPCIIGSVKTNIGHCEGASGLAGLIKVALCLKQKTIPPNLHFHEPNPAIPWQELPLVVAQQCMPWPEREGLLLAGVSSFGIAGTNAHIVVSEAPPSLLEDHGSEETPYVHLLTLSARSGDALKDMARRYQQFMSEECSTDLTIRDICYTASTRRTHHDYRVALVCHSLEEASCKLADFLHEKGSVEVCVGRRIASRSNRSVWIFPGQGGQWLGMGRDLLAREPIFRETIEQCDQVMRRYVDWSLLEQLEADEEQSLLERIDVVQPMLFAVQVALAALWRSWGMEPDAVVGHSMGEIAAAYVAGALNLENAIWIICSRSKLLLSTCGQGAMAAVELSLEQAQALVRDYKNRVSVAVSNSPNSTVLSGDPAALTEILSMLEHNGVFGRLVKVNVASHSPQMDPLQDDLLALLKNIEPQSSSVPIYSTVSGEVTHGQEFDASYWARNLRMPVLFLGAVQQLLEHDFNVFLEISSHPTLVGAVKQTVQQSKRTALVLTSLRREEDGRATMLSALGHLYALGYTAHWHNLYAAGGQHVPLPIYPWQRERFWNAHLEKPMLSPVRSSLARQGGHPLLGQSMQSALHPGTHFWEMAIDTVQFPYLLDHRIHGMVVLPSTSYIEMALAAGKEVFGAQPFSVGEIVLKKALFFPERSTQTIQLVLTPGEDGHISLQFFSLQADRKQEENAWMPCASATLRREEPSLEMDAVLYPLPEQVQREATQTISADEHYRGLRRRGIEHGPLFQGVMGVWQYNGAMIAQLAIPGALTPEIALYHLHPALMDACLQAIMAFLPEDTEEDSYVPVFVARVRLRQQIQAGSGLWSHAILKPNEEGNSDTFEGDVFLVDEDGQIIFEALGFRLQRLGSTQQTIEQRIKRLLYTLQWESVEGSVRVVPDEEQRKNWLIFSLNDDVGLWLARHLQVHGATCTIVTPGRTYRRVRARYYSLDPTSPAAFRQLLADAFDTTSHRCHGVVYLWGMQATQEVALTSHVLQTDQTMGSIGALHLVQALAATTCDEKPRLWLVTAGSQAICEADHVPALSQSPLWGLGRVIVYEHPDLRCTLVDMDATRSPRSVAALFGEVWSNDSADEVALRGNTRYSARLVRYQHPSDQVSVSDDVSTPNGSAENRAPSFSSMDTRHQEVQSSASLSPIHEDGSYLITGGLGGIGLKVAQWLVTQGARHLALLGRSEATEAARETLNVLREAGCEIRMIKADVAQAEQLANALKEIRETMPAVRGIIHSAVVLDDSILLQANAERFLVVMRPKIEGAWNLHQLTLEYPLDFFVMFSSAASLIGSPGQGNYAAANAFMDALAHYRRSLGHPALSINWGRWAEVGQATRQDRSERLDFRGFAGMKPQEGLMILGDLLRQSAAQVGVMSFNFHKWSQFYPELGKSSLFAHIALEEMSIQKGDEGAREERLSRAMLSTMNAVQCRQALEKYLSEQIAGVSGLSAHKLDAYQQLNRLGLDSLMAVELKNRIGADLNVLLPVATFLQGITIEQLAQQVIQHLEFAYSHN